MRFIWWSLNLKKRSIKDLSHFQADIDFRGVSYKYGYGPMYYQKLTCIFLLEVRPALLVSGSGKTTLAKMMVHFYAPNQGDICLGGVNQSADKQALRQYINYLPQQPYVLMELFGKFTLRCVKVRLKKYSARGRVGGNRSDIERMPLNCYQTELSADGAGISGGQRQRIALARRSWQMRQCLSWMKQQVVWIF